eukprot:jgi/Ulvmu1/10377/UM061_0060.1
MAAPNEDLAEFLKPDEDALSLITRLLSYDLRSGIAVLDTVAAFRKGAAIELVSATQAGKSTLCMEAAARFLLPTTWQGAHVGGLAGQVIFVDADLKFDLIQFLSICQNYLRKVLPEAQQGWVQPTSALMTAALRRLSLVLVQTSVDLVEAMEHFAASTKAEAQQEGAGTLLILDGAAAFLDVDRAGGLDPRLCPPQVPPGRRLTLLEAHARMAAAVDALCAQHVVVMLTAAAAVQFEDAGLECKAALPAAWEEVITSRLVLYRQQGEPGSGPSKQIARWLLPQQQEHYLLHEDGSCEAFR